MFVEQGFLPVLEDGVIIYISSSLGTKAECSRSVRYYTMRRASRLATRHGFVAAFSHAMLLVCVTKLTIAVGSFLG